MSGYKDDNPDDLPMDDFGTEDQFTEDQYDDPDAQSYDDIPADDDTSWDDQADDGQFNDTEQQPKKKSNLITYAIIGVVAVLGLGFVATQFMGGSETPVDPAAQTAEGVPAAAPEEMITADLDETPAPVATPPVDQSAAAPELPASPSLTGVDPGLAAPSSDTLPAPAPFPETPAATEDPAVISGLKPVSDFPSVDQIKMAQPAEPAPVAPVSAPVPVEAAPVPAPLSAEAPPVANAAELTVLQGKLDTATARIATLEKDLDAARTATPAPAADNSARVSELEAQVARLERQLEERSAAPAPRAAPVAPAPAEPPVAARPRSREAAPAPVIRTNWELRGAQPGKAMISRVGGGSDVRSVEVGDSVPGLGIIRSIEQTSAGWTVTGTLGSVRQ